MTIRAWWGKYDNKGGKENTDMCTHKKVLMVLFLHI